MPRVINVGVEKTADRRAAGKRSTGNFGADSTGWFLRAATRCSSRAVARRSVTALLMHGDDAKSVSWYREETKGRDFARDRAGSYGPREFIRTMIIYCCAAKGGERARRQRLSNLLESPKLSLEKSITRQIIIHRSRVSLLFFVYI